MSSSYPGQTFTEHYDSNVGPNWTADERALLRESTGSATGSADGAQPQVTAPLELTDEAYDAAAAALFSTRPARPSSPFLRGLASDLAATTDATSA